MSEREPASRRARLDPVCVLMKHVMPSQRHQLAMSSPPPSTRLAPASSPFASIAPRAPSPYPHDAAIQVPVRLASNPCRRRPPSLVCATGARPSISVKPSHRAGRAPHFARRSSLRTVIVGRKITGFSYIWLSSFAFSYVPLFLFSS